MKTLYRRAGFEIAAFAALAVVVATTLGTLMHAALNVRVIA